MHRSAPCWPASRELIDEAWRYKQMMGGAMRQAGIVAAAGLYALDHHVERLAEDHANARRLADGLAGARRRRHRPGPGRDQHRVFGVRGCIRRSAAALWERGVQITPLGPRRLRAVTHLDVDCAGIERALAVFRQVLEGPGG